MFERVELLPVDLRPRLSEPENRCQIETGENGHERVEVAYVVALLCHVHKEVNLHHSMPLFPMSRVDTIRYTAGYWYTRNESVGRLCLPHSKVLNSNKITDACKFPWLRSRTID